MGKIFLLVIVILLGVVVFQFGPTISDLRSCHESYTKESDEIGFRSRAQNYATTYVCEQTYEAIGTLDRCIQSAYSTRGIGGELEKFVDQLFVMTRPGTKDIAIIKAQHDEECVNYANFLFDTAN